MGFLAALAGCSGWFLHYLNSAPVHDVVTRGDLVIRINASGKDAGAGKSAGDGNDCAIDMKCFVWGPFDERDLAGLQPFLRKSSLEDQVVVSDRYTDERFIVYLGPLSNATAARAFVKQFRQQGFRKARPILDGELSYGVELVSFGSRDEADVFMASGRAPDVKGLKVTNVLGKPTSKVDLVFKEVANDQRLALFAEWQKRPGTDLKNCNFRYSEGFVESASAEIRR